MDNLFDISGRVAVMTGACGVLGETIVKYFAACGARVVLLELERTQAKGEQIVADIKAAGGEAMAVGCNVLEPESLEAARQKINAVYGKCDILINGAGGNNPKGTTSKEYYEDGDLENKAQDVKTFFDLDASGVQFVFNLNILGTLLTTQCFAKDMVGRENVSILNISSMNAFTPLTKIPAYSAAKAGVSNFTQWLAVHFAKSGIRVNAIAPGFFATNQNKTLLFNEDGSLTPRSDNIISQAPMGRFGVPADLTGALIFFCDEKYSAFVTGVILPIDGGFSAYSGV